MKISKYYEENVLVGDWQSVKIGLTVSSDKDIKSVEELEIVSEKLGELTKKIVRKELLKVKEERENNGK